VPGFEPRIICLPLELSRQSTS